MSKVLPENKQRKRISVYDKDKLKTLKLQLHPISIDMTTQIIKKLQTFKSYTIEQLRTVLCIQIQKKNLKHLLLTSLKYLFQPIVQALEEDMNCRGFRYKVQTILETVLEGKFYRHLSKQRFNVQSNKGTATNLKCFIAGLLAYTSSKLSLNEIEHALRIFQFQEKIHNTYPFGILFEPSKILKILKKLQRYIRPLQFKQWTQDFKLNSGSEYLQNYHFLYLINLTQVSCEENSYKFLSLKKDNDQIMFKDNVEEQKQHLLMHNSNHQNNQGLPHSQFKFKIRSFSYHNKEDNVTPKFNYQNIQQNIRNSQIILNNKRKSLTLLGRVKDLQNCQNLPFSRNKLILTEQNSRRELQKPNKENIEFMNIHKNRVVSSASQNYKPSIQEKRISKAFDEHNYMIQKRVDKMFCNHNQFRKKLQLRK